MTKIDFKFKLADTGKSKCSTCGKNIKKGSHYFSLGKYGGYHSTSWVKMCKECIFRVMFENKLKESKDYDEWIVNETAQKL